MAANCNIIPVESTPSSSCICSSPVPNPPSISTSVVLETVVMTTLVTCAFVIIKSSYDHLRRRTSRATFVIIGAGPSGVISAWIVIQTGRASRIIVFEERNRSDVLSRSKYMSLDGRSVKFLRSVGLDVSESVEGMWQHQNFVTRTGLFLEYAIGLITSRYEALVDFRFGTKFTKECLKELDTISERIVAIVCDGSGGRSASLLGLSDEFTQHSCRSYGAVATIDRSSLSTTLLTTYQPAILPEVRVHHLTIDLNSHCREPWGQDDTFPTSFHLKIFGCCGSCRSLALAVPRCESAVVRALKVILDQSVMRSIFQECFNKYKSNCEAALTDSAAVKCLKFSPRLFEIKLLQRMESAAYIEDANIFVVSEGQAARRVNFDSGMDINLVIAGLASLGPFVQQAVWVDTEQMILQALDIKVKYGHSIAQDFIRHGLKEVMYS